MLATQALIFTKETGRHYNKEQVLEFVFVQRDEDEFTFYVNDESRIMFFAVTIELVSPEAETEATLGNKILKAYDNGDYTSTPWELEAKGKEIYQALKAA
ncbi:hypothetical protein OTK49_21575 [Vibrio coralliirubri]|uniref:hypothetical protein n=1 Tax=Vibrio coralliirubri TaxID=1516159 RepID=UPI00228340B9|nr:hypothetical protein [Vibrio coralliirubri]MCY9865113.1 hypothetical protein [Vibrio coralliirubri]